MALELTENFVPNVFPHREKQLETIKQTFDSFQKIGFGKNLILLGTTGSGKTSLIHRLVSEHPNTIYISCNESKTTKKIFKKITNLKSCATSDHFDKIVDLIKSTNKVLILDEVGKIDEKDKENFFNMINALYRRTGTPIILITNKWTLINDMPDDARLTLFFQRVEFGAYTPSQLYDILESRIALLRDKGYPEMPDHLKHYLCAKVVKEHFSSARTVLNTYLSCLTQNSFTQESIDESLENIYLQEWELFINKLNSTEKMFLNILLELSEYNGQFFPSSEIIAKMPQITPSRVSQLVTSFEDYGIIKTAYHNKGKTTGRYRILSFVNNTVKQQLIKVLNPWEEKE